MTKHTITIEIEPTGKHPKEVKTTITFDGEISAFEGLETLTRATNIATGAITRFISEDLKAHGKVVPPTKKQLEKAAREMSIHSLVV